MKPLRTALFLLSFLLLPTKAMADEPWSVFEVICDAPVFQFSYGIRWNMQFLYPDNPSPSKSFFPSSNGETDQWTTYTCNIENQTWVADAAFEEESGWPDTKYELSYKQVGDLEDPEFDVLVKVNVDDELIIPEISLFKKCIFEDSGAKGPWDIADRNFVRMTFMRSITKTPTEVVTESLEIYMTRYGSDIEEDFLWITPISDSPIPHVPEFCGT